METSRWRRSQQNPSRRITEPVDSPDVRHQPAARHCGVLQRPLSAREPLVGGRGVSEKGDCVQLVGWGEIPHPPGLGALSLTGTPSIRPAKAPGFDFSRPMPSLALVPSRSEHRTRPLFPAGWHVQRQHAGDHPDFGAEGCVPALRLRARRGVQAGGQHHDGAGSTQIPPNCSRPGNGFLAGTSPSLDACERADVPSRTCTAWRAAATLLPSAPSAPFPPAAAAGGWRATCLSE